MKERSTHMMHRKIEIHGQGVGSVTREMVEQRARELAKMDGRRHANDTDLDRAYGEMIGASQRTTPPETSPELEGVTDWDEAPLVTGERTAKWIPENEERLAEELIEEGMDEAEHDRRLAAVRRPRNETE
jgi:hypothetical protein